jgi:hypothetical protein
VGGIEILGQNKTNYAACLKNAKHFLVDKSIRQTAKGIFLNVFTYANVDL